MESVDQEIDYLITVVAGLVDEPGSVQVTKKVDEMGVLLEISVAPGDMGKIIGKEGATAKAIRTIMNIRGMKNKQRISVKIVEPTR